MKKTPIFKNIIDYKNKVYFLQKLSSDVAYYMSNDEDNGIYINCNDLTKTIHEDNNDVIFSSLVCQYFNEYDDLYISSSIDYDYGEEFISKVSRLKQMTAKDLNDEYARLFTEEEINAEEVSL